MSYIGNIYIHNNIQATVIDEDLVHNSVLLKTDSGTELFISIEEFLNYWEYSGCLKNINTTLPSRASYLKNSKKLNHKVDKLLEYVFEVVKTMGAEIYVPKSNIKMNMFKIGGHLFMKTTYSCNSVKLYCRSEAVGTIYKPDLINNHTFDYVYVFRNFRKQEQKIIDYLVKTSMDYQIHKNNHRNYKNERR